MRGVMRKLHPIKGSPRLLVCVFKTVANESISGRHQRGSGRLRKLATLPPNTHPPSTTLLARPHAKTFKLWWRDFGEYLDRVDVALLALIATEERGVDVGVRQDFAFCAAWQVIRAHHLLDIAGRTPVTQEGVTSTSFTRARLTEWGLSLLNPGQSVTPKHRYAHACKANENYVVTYRAGNKCRGLNGSQGASPDLPDTWSRYRHLLLWFRLDATPMIVPLSLFDLLRGYEALGVTTKELEDIERAPFRQGEELLKRLKIRVSKAYKRLASQLHPDVTGGDPEKAELFSIVTRVAKDLSKRNARPDPPQLQVAPVKSAPVSGAKPPMRVNIRRVPMPIGGAKAREMAAKIAKMRP